MSNVRKPSVSGLFYPAEKSKLLGQINDFCADIKYNNNSPKILGLISQQIVLISLVEILLIDPIFSNIISIGFAAIVSFLLIENFVIEKIEHIF